MQKQKTTYLLALVLLLSACDGKPNVNTNPPQDPLRNARIQTANVIDAVKAGIQATIVLQKDGLITADEDRAVLGVLSKINGSAATINTRLQALTALDADSRTELSTILEQAILALQDANARGLLGVKNTAAKQRLDAILNGIKAALDGLKPVLGGTS